MPPRKRKAEPEEPLEGTVVMPDGMKVSLLDDKRRAMLVEALLAGSYTEDAIVYAGISRATFYRWMHTGRETAEHLLIDPEWEPSSHEAACMELMDAVEHSRAASTVQAIGIIRRAAREGTWQAAAWWLERTQPRKFGARREEDTGPAVGGGEVHVSLEELEQAVLAVEAQRAKQSR